MYSNDGAVLSTSTVAGSTVLGMALWPNLALVILGAAFVLLGGLYFFFKRRARRG